MTRHDQFVTPIDVINFYGKQECRVSREEIKEDWNYILEEITEIENREEFVIIMSDMNMLLGKYIKGDKNDKKNYGGSLLIDFLESEKYVLLNNSEEVENPNTRYDPGEPKNEEKWSCLDLVILSADLLKYFHKLSIDQNLAFTPYYIDSNNKIKYSDHFACLLTLQNIPLKENEPILEAPKVIKWNLNKKDGCNNYFHLSNNNKKLEELIQNDNLNDPDQIEKYIDKEMNKVKFQAFGKVGVKMKKKPSKELVQLQERKMNIVNGNSLENYPNEMKDVEEEIKMTMKRDQKENMKKEMESLDTCLRKKGSTATAFRIKEMVLGSKKKPLESISIKDPVTNNLITKRKEIMKTTLEYCKNLLAKQRPAKGYEQDMESKRTLHLKRLQMKDDEEREGEISYDMFQKALMEMARKKSGKYNFILKSGVSYKNALFKLFRKVWEKETKPEAWRKTTILQIPKGNSEPGNLSKMRNIHLKDPVPKLFTHIVLEQVKDELMGSMTKFQLGTKKGHRSQEHVFVVMSLMKYVEIYKEGLIVNLYDISKFFDKEVKEDVLGEAYLGGLRGKKYRLINELNSNTIIKVKTALGETGEKEVEDGIAQGGVESGILSALSLDNGVSQYFHDHTGDVYYVNVAIKGLLWQDDVLKANSSLEDAQDSNRRMEAVLASKS